MTAFGVFQPWFYPRAHDPPTVGYPEVLSPSAPSRGRLRSTPDPDTVHAPGRSMGLAETEKDQAWKLV